MSKDSPEGASLQEALGTSGSSEGSCTLNPTEKMHTEPWTLGLLFSIHTNKTNACPNPLQSQKPPLLLFRRCNLLADYNRVLKPHFKMKSSGRERKGGASAGRRRDSGHEFRVCLLMSELCMSVVRTASLMRESHRCLQVHGPEALENGT